MAPLVQGREQPFAGGIDFRQLRIKAVFNRYGNEQGWGVPVTLNSKSPISASGDWGRGGSGMAKREKYGLAVMAAMLLAVVSAQATSHVRIVR